MDPENGIDLKKTEIKIRIHRQHLYILMTRKEREPIVLDMANVATNNLELRKELKQQARTEIKPIQTKGQLGDDHCTSTRVLRIIELSRMNK